MVLTISAASASRYNTLVGRLASTVTNEAQMKTRIRKACTAKNLALNVNTNARTTNSTAKSRKNGADGAMSLVIAGGATGWFEDITNSDTLAVGDDYNHVLETLAGTEGILIRSMCVDLVTTDAYGSLITSNSLGLVQNANSTNYFPINGDVESGSVEADRKTKARDAFTLSQLTISLSANTVTAASTLRLRKNGANTAMVVTITASTTGVFNDNTNTESVTSTDDLNLSLVTGATGTSMTIRPMSLNALGHVRRYKTSSDTITIAEASISKIKATVKALSETETIAGAVTRINAALKTMATQTITIGDAVIRAITHVGAGAVKTLTETIMISELRARLKAVWRYQP